MADVGRDSIGPWQVKAAGWRSALGLRPYDSVAALVRREAAGLFLWCPAALVAGIWLYFALRNEPSQHLALTLGVTGVTLGVFMRQRSLAVLLSMLMIGFATAKLRADWVATPMLGAFEPGVSLQGYVSELSERSAKQMQLVLDVETATLIPVNERPRRVRVTAKVIPLQIGDRVEVKADLAPVARPEFPGGFELGRQLYFQSIGAVGRAASVTVLQQDEPPFTYRFNRLVHGLRQTIGAHIQAVIPGANGAFAEALITGERASIPRNINDSLMSSGLFHILSISGLHMTLVAGGVFWVVRALLALFPALALHWPIKKIAAVCAMFIGLFYMVLAGFGAATERSYIMIAVMFFAMLVDRPAVSLHNLAISAVIILLVQPEQAVAAGFQMSFMAVMGLAAFYEWWSQKAEDERVYQRSVGWRLLRKFFLGGVAAVLTTLIAGSLSGIVASHHFGRMAPYGVVSNALALPAISFLVMPMALIGTLLIPFGLEYIPFKIMDYGLDIVLAVSNMVASWPGSRVSLETLSASATVVLGGAAVVFCLLRTSLRWFALIFVVVGVFLSTQKSDPVVLIESRARNVAIVDQEGRLVPALQDAGQFAFRDWGKRLGAASGLRDAFKHAGWTCSKETCRAVLQKGTVAFLLEASETTGVCPIADVVVAQYPLRRRCKGKSFTIDRFDVWRNGAHSLMQDKHGLHLLTVANVQGKRPWVYVPRARRK